jgi:hypothetical protein
MCGDSFSHGRSALGDPFGKAILLGFGCPEGVRVGWGVSEVQAAFVTTPATVYGNHDDRALRLDRLLAGSSLHRFHYPRRNSVRRERLVDGRNNPFAFPQTRLGHLYAMTPLVFPAASTGFPLYGIMVASRDFAETGIASDYPHRRRSSSRSSKHLRQAHLKFSLLGISEWPHLLQTNLPSSRAIIRLNSSSESQ